MTAEKTSARKFSLKPAITICLLALLFCATFLARYKMYSKSNYPTGLDGYYYALQAKSFAETGTLENPDIECGYYLCGSFAKMCGDAIKGVKLCDAFTSAVTCFAAFILILVATKNIGFSFLAFVLTAVSPCFTLMGINFINNQIGLMFLLLFVALLLYVNEYFYSMKRFEKVLYVFGTVLLFVLCALSHKVTFVYSVFVLGIFLLSKSKKYWNALWQKKALLVCALSVFVICVIGGVLFVKLHAPRFMNSFKAWNLPLSKYKMFMSQLGVAGAVEIYLYYAAAWVCGILFAVFKKDKRLLALAVPVVFFVFWNPDSDMGIRILQNTVVVAIPICLYLIWNLAGLDVPSKKKNVITNIVCGILSAGIFSGLFFVSGLYDPKKDPPYEKYKKIAQKVELGDDSLLIAHLGLNHVYTYYQNLRDCLNWNCDFEVKDNDIWRLAYDADEDRIRMILAGNGFDYAQLCDDITSINLHYILIKEELWQAYLKLEDKEIAETFNNWYNPHEVRPEYIRKKRKSKIMFITFKRFIFNKWLDVLPSSCFGYRRFILRMMNIKVSKTAKVNSGFRVYGPGKIEIKDNAWIGQNVHIYTGGFVNVTIYENVQVGPETIFDCLTHEVGSKDERAGKCIHHDITVGKGTWIGCRSTILCSEIGRGCVIGAASVVLDDVPENKLAAGNPATVKKSYRK